MAFDAIVMNELVKTVMRIVLVLRVSGITIGAAFNLHDQEVANDEEHHHQYPREPVVLRPASIPLDSFFFVPGGSINLHIPGSWGKAHEDLEDLVGDIAAFICTCRQREEDVEPATHDENQDKHGC